VSSGTRLVVGFVLFAVVVFAALELYGTRAIARRNPDTPIAAAREAVQADNTVVGLIGAIESFEPIALEESPSAETARVEARVVGRLGSGRLVAELEREAGRWTVEAASITLTDGTTIPVSGSAGR
jgi:hypothetical protein